MNLKLLIFAFAVLPYIYTMITLVIIDKQRQKPLPAEVADIYTPERWQTFIASKHDMRAPLLVREAIAIALDAFVIFSPFFVWMEKMFGSNPYILTIAAGVILLVIEAVTAFPVNWYTEMVVRTKYGLNKKDTKEFMHDVLIDLFTELVMMTILYTLMTWILVHLPAWTKGFSISFPKALLLTAGIGLLLAAAVLALSYFSWQMMRRQYVFTEMEAGELRTKIEALTEGAKKKVSRIEVYNESKKSTSKNAFLFRLLWMRSFGVADNFLNENSEKELLAVLAHEAGHLKHKKNVLNYLNYVMMAGIAVIAAMALTKGQQIGTVCSEAVRSAFGLNVLNYMLVMEIAGWFFQPLMAPVMLYRNYVTRVEEYEADRNAVKEGYGEELIATFRQMSSDELVDVNPAYIIEVLEYDHPGMYRRIHAIHEAMKV